MILDILVIDVSPPPLALRVTSPAHHEQNHQQKDHKYPDSDSHELLPSDVVNGGSDGTVVDEVATVWPRGVLGADAAERADLVEASSSVLARRRLAFVDVVLAELAEERAALAQGAVVALLAHAAVFARVGSAIVAVFAALS